MNCKECAYYCARNPQRFYCGFYDQDFTYFDDDDLEVCSHFEEGRQ